MKANLYNNNHTHRRTATRIGLTLLLASLFGIHSASSVAAVQPAVLTGGGVLPAVSFRTDMRMLLDIPASANSFVATSVRTVSAPLASAAPAAAGSYVVARGHSAQGLSTEVGGSLTAGAPGDDKQVPFALALALITIVLLVPVSRRKR